MIMVSLGEERRRSNCYGGFCFENASETNQECDDLLDSSTFLGASDDLPFRRIRSTAIIIALMLLLVCLEVSLFIIPHFCPTNACGISSFTILVYVHATCWLVMLLADLSLRRQHNRSRMYGYLEFYRRTRRVRRVPVITFSAGNATLLVMIMLIESYCSNGICSGIHINRDNCLQIIVSLEVSLILLALCIYIKKTLTFNHQQPAPDVTQDDTLAVFVHSHNSTTDIGCRDESYLDDVLEKQADLIRYLKQHNAHLGRKILQLTSQNKQNNAS